jgi:leader peptidase (prepilin peptidase)/N-methyltransferase
MLFCDGSVTREIFFDSASIDDMTMPKFFTANGCVFNEPTYCRHKRAMQSCEANSSVASGLIHMLLESDAPTSLAFLVPLALLCVAIALIDIRHGIIPDGLNLAIAALGLLKVAIAGGFATGAEAMAEAIMTGIVFLLLRQLYLAWRRIDGLGLGDVKLLAASAPWLGIVGLPMQLLIAALAALATMGSLHLAGHPMTRQTSLPFGPFLAIGLLTTIAAQRWLGIP